VIRQTSAGLCWYPPGASGPPRELDSDEQREQLAALAAGRRGTLIFAVPGTALRLQELAVSPSEKRHIVRSLPFLLEEEFASDIEDLHFASVPLGRDRLAVASCEHALMQEWLETVDALAPGAQFIPEPLLLPWREGEVTVVIEADLVVVRSGEAEGFSVECGLAPAMIEAACAGREAPALVVYGEQQDRDIEQLPESLRQQVQWRTGGFGAALMLSEETRNPFDLRQGSYGRSLPVERWWKNWRVAAGLFGAAFALQVAGSWAGYSALEEENLALRQQREALYREAVPRGAIQDPERQLRSQLASLRGQSQGAGFVSLMDRIGRAVNAQRGAQLASINFSDKTGEVRFSVMAADFAAVESIRNRLVEAGLEAETENSNTQGDRVRARLKVRES
jgi:type II secretion system protein L